GYRHSEDRLHQRSRSLSRHAGEHQRSSDRDDLPGFQGKIFAPGRRAAHSQVAGKGAEERDHRACIAYRRKLIAATESESKATKKANCGSPFFMEPCARSEMLDGAA